MRWRTLALVCLVVAAGCVGSPSSSDSGGTTAPVATTDATVKESGTVRETAVPRPRVIVLNESGEELGRVTVELAETPEERYTGLSEHESLGANEGMLFVYGDEAMRTFVMRSMDFPIDMVFVGADGRITQIHHATVEADNDDLTEYNGIAKWVLEVPYNWTTEHGVEVGDRVRIER